MVPKDGEYEKLQHQSRFLRERGLASPEMEECNRRLWLLERLAGGDSTKLDSQLVERIHVELGEAAVKQLKATGHFDAWLDSWDVHNGIEVEEPTTAADSNPAHRLLELAEELQHALRPVSGDVPSGG